MAEGWTLLSACTLAVPWAGWKVAALAMVSGTDYELGNAFPWVRGKACDWGELWGETSKSGKAWAKDSGPRMAWKWAAEMEGGTDVLKVVELAGPWEIPKEEEMGVLMVGPWEAVSVNK